MVASSGIIPLIMSVSFCVSTVRGWRHANMIQRSNLVTRALKKTAMASTSAVNSYDHLAIEKKWQDYWDKNEVFVTKRRPGHPKKYVLDMFPYPSGSGLHVGHPEGYTATDIMARYWRMLDFDVLHPMGWDAFGLPAEQHAINTGTHPSVTTYENIATFKRQLKSLGFSYDWTRELATTDDGYVRWTQWIFLKLFKAGLAAQSEVSVNWCPALGTVLANEEIINGLSERGNHPVVRQPLRQWILKITQYADKLEDGLDSLQWPEGTLSAQKQWIGRSVGASIQFKVESSDSTIEVFTTRPDTIMGVTYVVLAPEHPLVSKLTTSENKGAVDQYIKEVVGKSDLERTATGADRGKTGVSLGAFAVHPITGEKVPIWAADYVLAGYGTGAVMAVPAHDERDFAFAELFNLEIKTVVQPLVEATEETGPVLYTGTGLAVNSGEFNGMTTEDCKAAVIKKLTSLSAGGEQVTYKLRDWVFSRQRYWGEPIPIYFPVEMLTEDGSGSPIDGAPHRILHEQPIAVDDADLPLKLPAMTNFQPGDDPRGCLARAVDWRFFQKDGKWFARETNTMPQWAGSCWYYLRFTDTKNTKEIFGEEGKSWLPVDLYVGGQEHAVLHLLYARFWHKVLFDIGVLDHSEPFTRLVHQGMILGTDGEKMSKSRGNVINPDDVVNEHGADALRLYEMFMGPLEAVKPWQTNQLSGVVRFRDRIFSIVTGKLTNDAPEGEILRDMHKTIKKVSDCVDRMAFNTAISHMMVFSNTLNALDVCPKEAIETLVLLLAPFAPHVAEEAWEKLGNSKKCISLSSWPTFDEALCVDTTSVLAVQINGKVRGKVEVDKNISQDDAMILAKDMELIKKYMDGMEIKKIIFVPGKILNIVLGGKVAV